MDSEYDKIDIERFTEFLKKENNINPDIQQD